MRLKLIIITTKAVHEYECIDYRYDKHFNRAEILTAEGYTLEFNNVKDVIVKNEVR